MLKQITKGATRNILHFYINQKKAKNIKKNKEKTRHGPFKQFGPKLQ